MSYKFSTWRNLYVSIFSDDMFETNYINEEIYKDLQQKCDGIRRLLITSVKTARKNIKG